MPIFHQPGGSKSKSAGAYRICKCWLPKTAIFQTNCSSKNDHIYILFVNLGRAVLILKVTMQIGFINLCMACASSSANFENSVKKGIFHVFYS